MKERLINLQQQSQMVNYANNFYISLSDLMLLLCVFFVMIIGISKIDIGSFEKIRGGVTGKTVGSLSELAIQMNKIAKNYHGVSVELAEDGVRVDFESAALFPAGKAVLEKDYLKPLQPMLMEIRKSRYNVELEGHTDDRPFYHRDGDEIDTNWSLSGKRAGVMADYLVDLGFQTNRIRIIGYSSTKPKTKVQGLQGQALVEARAKNRRVTILVK